MQRTTLPAHPDDQGKLRTTITITKGVWKQGGRRAGQERRNFSNYVEWLIARDVKANSGRAGA